MGYLMPKSSLLKISSDIIKLAGDKEVRSAAGVRTRFSAANAQKINHYATGALFSKFLFGILIA